MLLWHAYIEWPTWSLSASPSPRRAYHTVHGTGYRRESELNREYSDTHAAICASCCCVQTLHAVVVAAAAAAKQQQQQQQQQHSSSSSSTSTSTSTCTINSIGTILIVPVVLIVTAADKTGPCCLVFGSLLGMLCLSFIQQDGMALHCVLPLPVAALRCTGGTVVASLVSSFCDHRTCCISVRIQNRHGRGVCCRRVYIPAQK